MPSRAQKNLDIEQLMAGLEQARGDRQQAVGDREQRNLDADQEHLNLQILRPGESPSMHAEHQARLAEARLAQTRLATSQDMLDDAQRARDGHQALLNDQQAALYAPYLDSEAPAQAELRRAAQLIARAEAMEVRGQDAARRASQARNRADAALRRN
jgi:hypothetical protein